MKNTNKKQKWTTKVTHRPGVYAVCRKDERSETANTYCGNKTKAEHLARKLNRLEKLPKIEKAIQKMQSNKETDMNKVLHILNRMRFD